MLLFADTINPISCEMGSIRKREAYIDIVVVSVPWKDDYSAPMTTAANNMPMGTKAPLIAPAKAAMNSRFG